MGTSEKGSYAKFIREQRKELQLRSVLLQPTVLQYVQESRSWCGLLESLISLHSAKIVPLENLAL